MSFAVIPRFEFTYAYVEINTRYKFNVKTARCAKNITIKCSLGQKLFEVIKQVHDVASYCEGKHTHSILCCMCCCCEYILVCLYIYYLSRIIHVHLHFLIVDFICKHMEKDILS